MEFEKCAKTAGFCSAGHSYNPKAKYPVHFVVSYVQPVAQQYESKTV